MTFEEFKNRFEYNYKSDKIGQGSFGTVFKAYDTVRDQTVAIKVSQVVEIGDKSISLLDEYNYIKKVSVHKNIAHYEMVYRFETQMGIYDHGIMQYYPDGNLSEYIKRKDLSEDQKQEIALGLLDGLEHLHRYNIIHRDLKPSNILVVKRNGRLIPKITDFGLSKEINSLEKSQLTNSIAGGTLAYSSPEQIKGLPLKSNTDIWSLGVILYQIFTGKSIIDYKTNASNSLGVKEVIDQILNFDKLRTFNEVISPWNNIISKCLSVDNKERIKQVSDLKQILNYDEDKTIVLEPEHAVEKTQLISIPVTEGKTVVLDSKFETDNLSKVDSIEKSSRKKHGHLKSKKTLIGIATLLLVSVLGYGLSTQFNTSEPSTTVLPVQQDTISSTPKVTEPIITATKPIIEQKKVESKPKSIQSKVSASVHIPKIYVAGGSFNMGCSGEQELSCQENERPVHRVTVSSFRMSKYEITYKQFAKFLNVKGNKVEGGVAWLNVTSNECAIKELDGKFIVSKVDENRPVNKVTWYGAKAFAKWVGGRLPSEAEWEYAARGGKKSKGYKYAGSNDFNRVSWHKDNAFPNSQNVGVKRSNELGLFDMSGNMFEWCNDWSTAYTNSAVKNPKGSSTGTKKVVRGGGWYYDHIFCRVSNRLFYKPKRRYRYVGFRVVF